MLNRAEFRGATLTLGALVIGILLIAAVTPGLPGELLLQTLRFHIVALGIGIAVVAIAFGARWRGILGLLVVLVAGVHGGLLVWTLQERRTEIQRAPVAQFSFLSFNVLTGNNRAEELVETIVSAPPDVALIMETPGIEAHLARLKTVLPYSVGCAETDSCDISLHSRFPIEEGQIFNLPPFGHERLVVGRVSVDGQKVWIAGVHLSKPYFDQASFVELYHINETLNYLSGPMVLAGDFNAAPWTDPVVRLAEQQSLIPGPSMPATWPVRLGPLGVPIDNVFTRDTARILSLEAGDNLGSNHRPLRAQIGLYE